MPAISVSAPGKVILCGEHAVVYGTPAIALPVFQVSTNTKIFAHPVSSSGEVKIIAPVINLDASLSEISHAHPIHRAINLVLNELGVKVLPAREIRITSSIPFGAGLGSSASTSVSLIRALSTFLGHPFDDSMVNRLAFEIEKIHHGSPSGIDNTVITYKVPIYFQRGEPIQLLQVKKAFLLVIADSGIKSSTAEVVAGVRQRYESDPAYFGSCFDKIGVLTNQVRQVLESGDPIEIGPLMNQNHELLSKIGVSSSILDHLVGTALKAGAVGAKLSGGGVGGNIIALVDPLIAEQVALALKSEGAVRTILTTIPAWTGKPE